MSRPATQQASRANRAESNSRRREGRRAEWTLPCCRQGSRRHLLQGAHRRSCHRSNRHPRWQTWHRSHRPRKHKHNSEPVWPPQRRTRQRRKRSGPLGHRERGPSPGRAGPRSSNAASINAAGEVAASTHQHGSDGAASNFTRVEDTGVKRSVPSRIAVPDQAHTPVAECAS